MAKPCIVVAGQGRCGTSLTMQMLHAAGVPCVGRFPDFETDASSIEGFDPRSFAALSECAIKLIDPANLMVGDMPNHIVIWLDRKPREQAKSQLKLLSMMLPDVPQGRAAVRGMASSIQRDRNKHRARIGVPGGCPAITLQFEDLIVGTDAIARLRHFLDMHGWNGLSSGAMRRAITPRGPNCLPGMLEARLVPALAITGQEGGR